MKAIFTTCLIAIVFLNLGLAQVTVVEKASKSTITFKGFGTYNTDETTITSEEVKRSDSKNNFKGQGLAGKLVGKFFAKPADAGEIINLPESNIYEWDVKKKKCSVRPIKKLELEPKESAAKEPAAEDKEDLEKEKERESSIEIIKSEFKVEKTGKSGTVNNFPFDEYWINAYTLWRDKQSGMIGCDSLSVLSSMTPHSESIQKGMAIEAAFATSYLEKLGINLAQTQDALLGSQWLKMLQQMKSEDVAADSKYQNMADEMAKLDGLYPVVTDGKYYARRSGGEQMASKSEEPQEESTDVTDVKKGLGGLAKGMFGKKKEDEKPKGLEPALAFYTEVLKWNVAAVDAGRFTSPFPCK